MEMSTNAEPAGRSNCPRCSGPLFAADVPPHGLLGCVSCGGVFLSHSAVRTVLSRSQGHAALERFAARTASVAHAHPEHGGPAACPVCMKEMAAVDIRGLGTSARTCNAHGSWFEAGDLARLQPVAAALPRPDTPESSNSARSHVAAPVPAPAYSSASLTSRLAASIFDGLFWLPAFTGTALLMLTDAPGLLILLLGFGSILTCACLQIYWAATRGQTFGKRKARIRVVRADGSPAGAFRILVLRNFLPYCLAPWAIGAAWQLLDTAEDVPGVYLAQMALWPLCLLFSQLGILLVFLPARRAVHDYVAGTIVVGA